MSELVLTLPNDLAGSVALNTGRTRNGPDRLPTADLMQPVLHKVVPATPSALRGAGQVEYS